MSQYYNPKRGAAWNYGGENWRLSRSKIDLFIECPRCFYIDNKLGVKRPPGFPFNLNSAVDFLLKKEFDVHRTEHSPHPLMEHYSVNAVPFEHEDIDIWRDNFKGIEYKDPETGFVISGAIDDVWQDAKTKELIVVDYKSTSKDGEITLDAEWQNSYKRQMEVYQWLFRKNGFDVSDTGYFVYANGKKDKEAFDGKLEFDVTLIAYIGKTDWIDKTLGAIKACLEDERVPKAGSGCDYCPYREAAGHALQAKIKPKTPPRKKLAATEEKTGTPQTESLF